MKLWDEIKYHIQTINANEFDEYDKDYMKIKFDSDDNLPLNKMLKSSVLTVIIRSVFEKDGKCYPQIFLDDCLYEKIKLNPADARINGSKTTKYQK